MGNYDMLIKVSMGKSGYQHNFHRVLNVYDFSKFY